jgi:hypothetical protein
LLSGAAEGVEQKSDAAQDQENGPEEAKIKTE